MAAKKVENEFDERRESLVVEIKTIWPDDIDLGEAERTRIAAALHRNPKDAKRMHYVRCPTGLVRHITVMPEDVERLR